MAESAALAFLRRGLSGRRIVVGAVVGALLGFLLPETVGLPLRIAAGWVIAVAIFLGWTAFAISAASAEQMRRRARLQDSRRWIILVLIVMAAGVSLLALGVTIGKVPDETQTHLIVRILLAGLTIVGSWMLTHTVFALHYAHHFYGDDETIEGLQDRRGLAFPGKEEPDYWDFLYFSFVVGMTCQVSDVQVTSRSMRRMTLLHGVLSFFFNTVILALAVNVVASSL
jgi:uncharacterized membrane protein